MFIMYNLLYIQYRAKRFKNFNKRLLYNKNYSEVYSLFIGFYSFAIPIDINLNMNINAQQPILDACIINNSSLLCMHLKSLAGH